MSASRGPSAPFAFLGSFLALATLACSALIPTGSATATPTGQIGAVEVSTPGLQGSKRDLQVWTGTITSQTTRQFFSNGSLVNTCNTDWVTDLDFAVDPVGDVLGSGSATLSPARTCSPRNNLVTNTQAMQITVTGKKGASAFDLLLGASAFEPAASGDFGGYFLLFNDGTCPAQRRSLSIPFSDPKAAEAQLDLTATMTGCGGSENDVMSNQSLVKLRYRFKCSEVPADLNDPTITSLCQ